MDENAKKSFMPKIPDLPFMGGKQKDPEDDWRIQFAALQLQMVALTKSVSELAQRLGSTMSAVSNIHAALHVIASKLPPDSVIEKDT